MPRPPQSSAASSSLSDRVYGALLDEARRRPPPVHLLNVGDTYLEPMARARAEAQLSAEHPRLHNYAPVQGEPSFLDAIVSRVARVHGVTLARENVQVMPGATGGFTSVATALLEPGDEVLLLSPFWPLIRGIIASRSASAVEVPFYTRLDEPGFDAEALIDAAVTPKTVAVYLNTPNNPTGRVLSPSVVDAVARAVNRLNLWLWCDEAYEELWYGPARPEPVWARGDLRDRAVACHTLSKSYALAGARLGFTHGPPSVMPAIRGTQTFLTYCAPRPLQHGGARALAEGDAWVDETRRLYADAAERAAEVLKLPRPEGGTFFFFDAARHFRDGEDMHGFLRRCLDAGVLLTPGAASGRDFGTWVRLCFTAVPPAELEDAVRRLAGVLTT
jgi:N-succinyldiaminopimelate aminotransferase